ncbi:DUF2812 domain-containing protein [Lysinibacillus pakistanensis]|uniref:DUF2812 domain-containing protein n=1 Tax=Lysinibacillus pakistanensis TaxID=759811 RepID=UPI003D293FC9
MKITKYRIFIDAQKETDWLNEMAAKGYELKKTNGFSYRFKQSEEKKQYKVVYTINKEEASSFMSEENGILCKAFINGYAYFESKSSNESLLFNNNLSKQIKLLKNRQATLSFILAFNIFMGTLLLYTSPHLIWFIILPLLIVAAIGYAQLRIQSVINKINQQIRFN